MESARFQLDYLKIVQTCQKLSFRIVSKLYIAMPFGIVKVCQKLYCQNI